MKVPAPLQPLLEDGLIDEVVRPLRSGKEATVYVVRCGEELRCAKVYKDVRQRGFRQAVQYQEGRKVRNTRQARAMEKRTSYGRREQETAWHSAEVNALYRLVAAGVRVPLPQGLFDGVLLMELIVDAGGDVAPRLGDLVLEPQQACAYHARLIGDIVRMLCAGMVHGDLSEYNVLVGTDGPVIIDLPQAVEAAVNNSAQALLERDVANMTSYLGHFAPQLLGTAYGPEIWQLYAAGDLSPDSVLTGQVELDTTPADVVEVLREIEAARQEALMRQEAREAAGQ
ncbi:MAG: PA4780 family RIO1-like protein kinase [Immundisolibacter sp.]|uniref:PA4780 family RIO1-like protein kinase n=1 Tax=Immundisolibacter sp. TaxID=1934948 RepID=UPI003EE2C89A